MPSLRWAAMLRRLRIENLVLIREAELELAPGLNAITGETGAGKTILAQAVGLLLGTKGDDAFVGPAGEEAYVEAELDLPEELDELGGLRPEDEEALLVARRVFGDGRTRAYAWGRAAAREDVAATVERVLAMSGQFEQRRLARPAYQLEVLDRFCGDEQRDAELRLRETASELHSFLASLEAEPARRDEFEAGLDRIAEAKRRFRATSYDELLQRASDARAELAALDEGVDPAAAAAAALAAAESRVHDLANELRAERNSAAPAFADAVAAELHDVGMGEGEFACELRERDPGSTGGDEAVFLVRPNAGMPFGPVAETASGGELSRIALAIAAVAGGDTLVFDEIDAGIGDETANAVGRVLKRLSERAQVITITHLPQIAALADRHFRVEKVPGDPTHTRIERLGDADRKAELERMLGGQEFLATVR